MKHYPNWEALIGSHEREYWARIYRVANKWGDSTCKKHEIDDEVIEEYIFALYIVLRSADDVPRDYLEWDVLSSSIEEKIRSGRRKVQNGYKLPQIVLERFSFEFPVDDR